MIDETLKKYSDLVCDYGYAPRGEHATAQVWVPADAVSRWSSISSMSIEGPQSNFLVNTSEETVNAATFSLALENDIMPLTYPYPGDRSVLIMDNCRIHQKHAIYEICARYQVFCIFLPPYSPDFSPIELMFNCTKNKMQRLWGSGSDMSVEAAFRDALWSSVTAEVACKMFEKCYFKVSPEEVEWATR